LSTLREYKQDWRNRATQGKKETKETDSRGIEYKRKEIKGKENRGIEQPREYNNLEK
jgi:hypothetical protein